MGPVLLESRANPVRNAGRVAIAAALALFALSLAGLLALVRVPDTVDQITIENQSDDELAVAVTGAGGQLPITVVDPGSRATVSDVLDQGDGWAFVLDSAGDQVGVIRQDRSDLEAAGWRLVIPEGIGGSTER